MERIRYKALMRRARARSEAGGWSNLAGAKEDYEELAKMGNVSPGDRKIVREQLRVLPPRIEEAQNREKAEMFSKLKEVSLSAFNISRWKWRANEYQSNQAGQWYFETVWLEHR